MDYTGAERLKSALEKLERYVQSGGGFSAGSTVDSAELTSLKEENAALKGKHQELSEEVGSLITVVEEALKSEEAA